jgi:hypothetical protein
LLESVHHQLLEVLEQLLLVLEMGALFQQLGRIFEAVEQKLQPFASLWVLSLELKDVG